MHAPIFWMGPVFEVDQQIAKTAMLQRLFSIAMFDQNLKLQPLMTSFKKNEGSVTS